MNRALKGLVIVAVSMVTISCGSPKTIKEPLKINGNKAKAGSEIREILLTTKEQPSAKDNRLVTNASAYFPDGVCYLVHDGKAIFVDTSGKPLIDFPYYGVEITKDSKRVVDIGYSSSGITSILDHTFKRDSRCAYWHSKIGTALFSKRYELCFGFQGKYDIVAQTKDIGDVRYGIINKKGKEVFPSTVQEYF